MNLNEITNNMLETNIETKIIQNFSNFSKTVLNSRSSWHLLESSSFMKIVSNKPVFEL